MLSAALALSASLIWGVSDFVGGLLVRRHAVVGVIVLAQVAGLVALAVLVAAAGMPLERDAIELGLLAGLFGALSLGAFYQAMALGTISIASPLVACGSVLAFGLAVAAGERPSSFGFAGAIIVLIGIVLASIEEHAAAGPRRSALMFAFGASLMLGFHLYLLGRASEAGGSISAVLGSRLGSFGLLALLAVVLRPSFPTDIRAVAVIFALGITTVGSLMLFGFAAQTGLISIASVLSSIYPIVTVLLAYFFIGERLHGQQRAGVLIALTGVVLVTVR